MDDLNVSLRLATASARSLTSMPGIQALSLRSTLLGDDAFEMLAGGCSYAIKKLDIAQNMNLTAKSYKLIASIFPNLEHLNCEKNKMSYLGLKSLI